MCLKYVKYNEHQSLLCTIILLENKFKQIRVTMNTKFKPTSYNLIIIANIAWKYTLQSI